MDKSELKVDLFTFKNDDSLALKTSVKDCRTQIEGMQEVVEKFFKRLLIDIRDFSESKKQEIAIELLKLLLEYIYEYQRILYSSISNIIYEYCDTHTPQESGQAIENMLSNIENIIDHFELIKNAHQIKIDGVQDIQDEDYNYARKALLKIWDHISLAQQQYSVLKMTNGEFDNKIDDRIVRYLTPVQQDIMKDMNSQMLSMVGVFTALAFLLFGGISSLENLFQNSSMPVLKFMVVGSIWCLCLTNMIYIFLLCIEKISKYKIDNNTSDASKMNVFQKYSVMWWSDFITISILLLSLWGYYLQKKNAIKWIDFVCLNPGWPCFLTIVLISIIVIIGIQLFERTKPTGNQN